MELTDRVRRFEAGLEQDDAQGSLRATLGRDFMLAGDGDASMRWYLDAARHASASRFPFFGLLWAKQAVRANPENLEARREYLQQWRSLGHSRGRPPSPL